MTSRRPPPLDWGVGRYEHTAAELEPAAETVVALARIRPGEEVLDLACGTGNAALLAARAGARATGIDSAQRLTASYHAASIAFHGASPERYFEANEEHHPMTVAMRPLLARAGSYPAVREEALAVLRAGNEDPQAFRVTAPFVVIELQG